MTGLPNFLDRLPYMTREHDAWLAVVAELRARGFEGLNAGEPDEKLHDAIVLWGEELAQLRLNDPDPTHAERALSERRQGWAAWQR